MPLPSQGKVVLTIQSQSSLQITVAEKCTTQRKQSAGWASSLVVHSFVLLLLWILLAPADIGGMGVRELILTMEDESETSQIASFKVAPAQTTTTPSVQTNEKAHQPSPDAVAAPHVDGSRESDSEENRRALQQGPDAPTGSFFGIKSSGQNFVYVLDVSGSMKNGRFERAAAELLKSVDQLNEQQNFYVLLFNSKTTQLFNKSGLVPAPVACTEENKERLAQWLTQSSPDGGTDPRDALRIALKMKPSAIFMLSDGKFDSVSKRAMSGLTSTESTAFSIVAADENSTPIHSVALENLDSRENMQRISNITKGKYRFAERRTDENAQATFARAQAALKKGNTGIADVLLSDLAVAFPNTNLGHAAKRRLAELRFHLAFDALGKNKEIPAKLTITKLVESFPSVILTPRFRDYFFPAFVNAMHPTDPASKDGSKSLAKQAVNVQTTLNERPVMDQSKVVIDFTLASRLDLNPGFPHFSGGAQSRSNPTGAIKRATHEPSLQNQLLNADVETIQYLRQVTDVFGGTSIASTANDFLKSIAEVKSIELRESQQKGDNAEAQRINQQLDDAFADHPTLASVQSRFLQNERKAKNITRIAERLERVGRLADAKMAYARIVENYPLTLAARKAKIRLQVINQQLGFTGTISDEIPLEALVTPDQRTPTDQVQARDRTATLP